MNAFRELSDTEMEIMEVLWSSSEPKTFAWILDYFNSVKEKEWKKQTLSTYMLRLGEKDVIHSKRVGRTFEYSPNMTVNEYESAKAKGILDNSYDGSIRNFMLALYEGNSVSEDEMSELEMWIKEQKEKR